MPLNPCSLRPFVGTRDRAQSTDFYLALGFTETYRDDSMSYLQLSPAFGIYLQDYYVKDWVDNTMLFLEVDNLEVAHREIAALLDGRTYGVARVSDIVVEPWGREFFLHDPEGILWHVGTFSKQQ